MLSQEPNYLFEAEDIDAESGVEWEARREALPSACEAIDEDSLKLWWKRISQHSLLTAAQEIELSKRVAQGDDAAFHQMVEANLRLVGSIARKCSRHAGNALSLADLVQEGSVGLIRAVQKFDHRRGYRFSTYATYWIRQSVMRAIEEQGRSIRLPVHRLEASLRADRARATLTQELQRAPSNEELERHLTTANPRQQHMALPEEPISLHLSVNEDEDSCLMDNIVDTSAASPADSAMQAVLRAELERALEVLSERERQVICLRYGLGPYHSPSSLDEVGYKLSLTRERIRQIEKSALKRLQRCDALLTAAREPHDDF